MTDSTWRQLPGSNDYDSGPNWSGNLVPDGTASFGSSKFHSLVFSDSNSVGGWTFKPGASNYSFHVPLGKFLEFTGAGIVVQGGGVTIVNDQDLHFETQSTAGKAHITNNETTQFNTGSTAGASTITNNNYVAFLGTALNPSTAGKAQITNRLNGSVIDFKGYSEAGSAHIVNFGKLNFRDNSSAKNATIESASADVSFTNNSNAGHANIVAHFAEFVSGANAGHAHIVANQLSFYDATDAGAAVITVAKSAFLQFVDLSNGGTARLITKAGATVDFSRSSGPASDHKITVGSIEGAGTFNLGENKLYVGSNNRSTKVSGAIEDRGTGAVLHKEGTGTLTLSHANNTYSHGTVLTQGTLDIAAKGAAGPDSIYFDAGRQVLKIDNKALTNHDFGNIISFFGQGDTIDLAGLKFAPGAKASYVSATGLLKVKSGGVTDTLHLNDPTYVLYKAVSDGHGGTKIVPNPHLAKPVAHSAAENHDSADHPVGRVAAADPASGDSFAFGAAAGLGQQRSQGLDSHLGSGAAEWAFNDVYGTHQPDAPFVHDGADFHTGGQHALAQDFML